MIRRHLMVLRLALMVVDALSAALVFALVSLVRFGDGDAAEHLGSDRHRHPVGRRAVGRGLGPGAVVPRPLSAARPVAPADRGPGHRPGHPPGAGDHAVGVVRLPRGQRQPAVPRPAVRDPAAGHAGRANRSSASASGPCAGGATTRGSCSSSGPGRSPRASPTGSRVVPRSGSRSSATCRSRASRTTSSLDRSWAASG